MKIFKVGTYKSAYEPFTQNEMSEANRGQISSYLNDTWSFIRKDLAESRSLSIEKIDSLANIFTLTQSTDFLLAENLVDTILYETEMKEYLRSLLNIDSDKKIPSATVADMKSVKTKSIEKTSNTIALLYAHGNIVRSEEHTSELQSRPHLVCRLLLEKKKLQFKIHIPY